uniref:Alanine--tRNA ligase n=1 Tax=candidate division CPR3 bacterium TaxID=2268181 RepID=A0A7C4R4G5_UNCC3
MQSSDIRQKFLDFFKDRGHAVVPSASLLPENDPTTLFTGSGMQPMVPYLLGEKHPLGTRITDSQKCFRSQDIEEVGDNRHTTFFEMLGNWSFGDYFKKEQISWVFEFLTKEIDLDPKNIYITVFRGKEDIGIPKDTEAAGYWKEEFAKVGIDAKDVDFSEQDGMQGGRVFYYDETKNWWSRAGVTGNMPVGEPGGPDSEIFWDFGKGLMLHENSPFRDQPCHVNCDCGRFLEIGNNVFMQYIKKENGFEPLPHGNIDFGGGLERISAASNGDPDIFKTDLFSDAISKIEGLSGKKYKEEARSIRIIADHIRSATFLIADGVFPSNTAQGYFVRRLIRRSLVNARKLGIEKNGFCAIVAESVIAKMSAFYPELFKNQTKVFDELHKEENKFKKTLEMGMREFQNYELRIMNKESKIMDGKVAFDLFQSSGFPIEITQELAAERGISVDMEGFNAEFKKHQELSQTASSGMFKGGLADDSEISTRYHTSTHLLLAAIRQVLGEEIYQKGSNITAERVRFDFNYPEKVPEDKLKEIEELVNEKIQEAIPVQMMEMPKEDALANVKVSFDASKYPDMVKVYKIGSFSSEVCGGPHVANTSELGHFKIIKEESSSAGVRRIKAVLE